MPTYIIRTISDYPTEFYKSGANPEGFEFACYFCGDYYKTKKERVKHAKQCCYEKGIDYGDDTEVTEDLTISDMEINHTVFSTLIKYYITNNTLESYANKTHNQITSHIQKNLSEGGFNGENLYEASFNIYKFFFKVTDEEWKEFVVKCRNIFLENV